MTPSPAPNRQPTRLLKVGTVLLPVAAVALWAASAVPSALRARRESAQNAPSSPYFKPYSNPYPRTQNGLRFVATFPARTGAQTSRGFFENLVHRPDDFWIDYKEWYPTAVIEFLSPTTAGSQSCRASARASDGEILDLSVVHEFSDAAGKTYVSVSLPWPGVPATWKWIDLTFTDGLGKQGTWRVWDLARLDHAVVPSSPVHTDETVQGIPFAARAWWDEKAAPAINKTWLTADQVETLPIEAEVKAELPENLPVRSEQTWEVKIDSVTQEWDVAPTPTSSGGQNDGVERMSRNWTSSITVSPNYRIGHSVYATAQAAVAPHPAVQRVARIQAHLTKTENYAETLAFRNVPLEPNGSGWRIASGGAALTTPSDVRVQLAPPLATEKTETPDQRYVAMQITASPRNGPLPHSPLQQRVGKETPLRVTCDLSDRNASRRWNAEGQFINAELRLPQPVTNPVLPFLAVTVKQEAQVGNIPLTFIVPVKHGAPKDNWAN